MVDDDRSMIQFITEMQADKSARDAIISGCVRTDSGAQTTMASAGRQY